MHFGEHVTIDGYEGNPAFLNDEARVRAALTDLCNLLGMSALADPQVVSAPDNGLKDPGGWSGFIIIAESHIALHTFPRRHFLSADVYSCQNNLAVDDVVDYFKEKFALGDTETHFIKRGMKYSEHNLT